jgi:hypothetical protein
MSYVVVNVASAECESPRAAFPGGTHAVAKSEGSKGQIGQRAGPRGKREVEGARWCARLSRLETPI